MSLLRGPNTSSPPRFIEEKSSFEYGQVNQALAAAMRTLVKEHLILVSQLEQLQRRQFSRNLSTPPEFRFLYNYVFGQVLVYKRGSSY